MPEDQRCWYLDLTTWDPSTPKHHWDIRNGRATLAGDVAHPMTLLFFVTITSLQSENVIGTVPPRNCFGRLSASSYPSGRICTSPLSQPCGPTHPLHCLVHARTLIGPDLRALSPSRCTSSAILALYLTKALTKIPLVPIKYVSHRGRDRCRCSYEDTISGYFPR